MGRLACAGSLQRACIEKIGALCLIPPLATQLMLRSLSSLAELYSQDTDKSQPSFMSTPACVLVLCIVILVAITVTSSLHERSRVVPSHELHPPFNSVQEATITSPQCQIFEEAPAVLMREMPSISSHPCCLSSHHELHTAQNDKAPSINGATSLVRSPPHDTFSSGKQLHPARSASASVLVATENLSDEEINHRFSAFIESRFAAMRRERAESDDE